MGSTKATQQKSEKEKKQDANSYMISYVNWSIGTIIFIPLFIGIGYGILQSRVTDLDSIISVRIIFKIWFELLSKFQGMIVPLLALEYAFLSTLPKHKRAEKNKTKGKEILARISISISYYLLICLAYMDDIFYHNNNFVNGPVSSHATFYLSCGALILAVFTVIINPKQK